MSVSTDKPILASTMTTLHSDPLSTGPVPAPDCIPTSTTLTQPISDPQPALAPTSTNITTSNSLPPVGNEKEESVLLPSALGKLSIEDVADLAQSPDAANSASADILSIADSQNSNGDVHFGNAAQNGDSKIDNTSSSGSSTGNSTHPPSSEPNDVANTNIANTHIDDQSAHVANMHASSPPFDLEKDRAAPVNPASALEGGREVSEKILYCGGLNKLATEQDLMEIFGAVGPVQLLKVLHDKNRPSHNYAFVEFESSNDASNALNSLQGTPISGSEIRLNWAYQLATNNSSTLGTLYNIFVGDLLPEVDDESLGKAFAKYPSLAQAHVMWDMQTSRLRGYGFVTFMLQVDAEQAIESMNGEWINGRAIRCNWASHRQQQQRFRGYPRMINGQGQVHGQGQGHSRRDRPYGRLDPYMHPQQQMPHMMAYPGSYMSLPPPPPPPQDQDGHGNGGHMDAYQHSQYDNSIPHPAPPPPSSASAASMPVMSPLLYDIVLRQTPSWQTTVYLGNIAHFTVEQDLIPLLQNFGYIVDFKFQPERGCAFVRFDSHERAALAIVQLAGFTVNGRPLRCGWGKDRLPIPQFYSQVAPHLTLFVPGRQ